VQQNNAVPQTPQTTVRVTYTNAQAAGDTNILAIGWSATSATIASVTDSKGNVYQAALPATNGSNHYQAIYYARNIVAAAGGANVVTVTFSTAVNYPDIRILEYSGLDPANPFDVGRSASGTGTVANSGSVTTSSARELIFAAGETADVFVSAGSGFVSRVITSPDGDIAEDKTVSATGTYNATANLRVSTGWLLQVATFRAPVSGGTGMTSETLRSTAAPVVSDAVSDASGAPAGAFDTLGAQTVAGAIPLTGWALDDRQVNRVELWRNCIDSIDRVAGVCAAAFPGGAADFVFIGEGVFLAGSRPDVEVVSSTAPQAHRAGWGYTLVTNALPDVQRGLRHGGQGTFELSAVAVDDDNQFTVLGRQAITVDNDHATIPFGAIATPSVAAPAATITSVGWALTQRGKCIDVSRTDSYTVYVDGVPRTLTQGGASANWFPGLADPQIAAAYPGLCNTTNALAAYRVDVTRLGLENGLHTLRWDATDAGGNVGSIGNAAFFVAAGMVVRPEVSDDLPARLGLESSLASFTTRTGDIHAQFGTAASPFEIVRSSTTGTFSLGMPASGRLALDLGGPIETGYEVVGSELRPLPGGSYLDRSGGLFTWAPPPSHSGSFHLVFVAAGERIDVLVTIGGMRP